MLFLSYIFSW